MHKHVSLNCYDFYTVTDNDDTRSDQRPFSRHSSRFISSLPVIEEYEASTSDIIPTSPLKRVHTRTNICDSKFNHVAETKRKRPKL